MSDTTRTTTTHHPRNGTEPDTLPGTIPDVLPPNNVEAEEALLGSILVDDNVLLDIANLTGQDFFIDRHGWIFDAAKELFEAGEPVDLVTLCDRLEHQNRLAETGGSAYLTGLINATPTHIHGPYYANIVAENAALRRLNDLASDIVTTVYDRQRTYDDKRERIDRLWLEASTDRLIQRAQWQIYTLEDAYKPRPPVEYIVEDLFPIPSLSIVYGAPGTMKSLVLADMLVCVAAGLPWLDALPGEKVKSRTTMKAPAMWLDFDNGRRMTHERFEAFGRARGLEPAKTSLYYVSMPTPWLDASSISELNSLANKIDQLDVQLLVIDNLGTVSGGVDENSAEMIQVMANLRRLAEDSGCAVVVIHHQRKSNGVKGRAGDRLRGHSSIEAALDLALLIEREEQNDRVSLKSTKTRGVDVLPFSAQFGYEHKPDSVELAEARFFGVANEESEDIMELYLNIVSCIKRDPGISKNKLRTTVKNKMPGASHNAIRQGIDTLVESGQLRVVEGGAGLPSAYYANDEHIDF